MIFFAFLYSNRRKANPSSPDILRNTLTEESHPATLHISSAERSMLSLMTIPSLTASAYVSGSSVSAIISISFRGLQTRKQRRMRSLDSVTASENTSPPTLIPRSRPRAATLQRQYTAPTTAPRSGHFAATETTLLQRHGTAEPLSIHTMQ